MTSSMPYVPKELLEYLEETFPNQSPSLKTPDREIWFVAGKADLIGHLRGLYEEQIKIGTLASTDG